MKRSGLRFRFDPLDILVWEFWHQCMWCGQNKWDCLHHIISPSSYGHRNTEANASILNSSPMHNHGCHLDNGRLHWRDMEIKLLQKTYDALTKRQGYRLKEIDREFIDTYMDSHYKQIKI